jgi:hypothetical protein
MLYGPAATVAVETAPALLKLTLLTLSVLTNPLAVNSLPVKVSVCP